VRNAERGGDSGCRERPGHCHEKAEPGHEIQAPGTEKAGPRHEIQAPRTEEAELSHEVQRSSSERTGTGHEMERERQEMGSSSRVSPALTKDRRIEERESKYSDGKKGDLEGKQAGLQQRRDVEAIFEYWKQRTAHPEAKLTREREMKIGGRLEEGYTVEQLQEAVEGCRGSPFHQGDNERGHRYDDITLICRSGSKVEQFVEMARGSRDETRQCGNRSNVRKIMQGIELVRSRSAESRNTGDDNKQSEGRMLTAGAGT
jgi:hypothetical protein